MNYLAKKLKEQRLYKTIAKFQLTALSKHISMLNKNSGKSWILISALPKDSFRDLFKMDLEGFHLISHVSKVLLRQH